MQLIELILTNQIYIQHLRYIEETRETYDKHKKPKQQNHIDTGLVAS